MLNNLTLENFKAWRRVDLTFGKVTGFFGTNSAGKSSLLHFLLLLKQTRNATDRGLVLDFGGSNSLVELGTFNDVIHGHDTKAKMRWLLDWTLPKRLRVWDPMSHRRHLLFKGDSLKTECQISLRKTGPWQDKLAYYFGGAEFALQSRSTTQENFELVADACDFEFSRFQGRPARLLRPIKTYLFCSQAKNNFKNSDFLGDFELEYENFMDSLYYLGPLREHPQRDYNWSGSSPADVGRRGELTMDAILAATRDGEERRLKRAGPGVRKKPFQEIIAHWLRVLRLTKEFQLEEIAQGTNLYRAIVKTSPSSVSTALTDVGFGVSQVLPALVLLYYVPEGSTVLMEQPEIHLHPAVQSDLADIMLNVASVRNVQIVVESHSEHLMRRLQRRVAEGKVPSDDVKLYFVSSHRGSAVASDLALNKWGEIENWPENFFGDEMGEISAIAESSLRRRMNRF